MSKARPKPRQIGFFFLFMTTIFITLLLTVLLFSGAMYVFARSGLLQHVDSLAKAYPILICGICTLVVGMFLSGLFLRVPFNPVRRLINGMHRLAEGHFEERLDAGEYPIAGRGEVLHEVVDSFNTLAEELQNTEMLRSDFVNNFSHEFKTPIVSINGFAKLLRRGDLSEEETREYLDIIVEESTRLANMATGVLDLTRIENQTILTNLEAFNLSEQLRRCILMQEKLLTEKNLEVEADFPEYSITGNVQLLKQTWINLFHNAVKFSPAGGVVRVNVCPVHGGMLVSFENSGPAIPPENLRRVFDKFWQGDTSHASEGTGIGLSVVKKAVELHGGKVDVKSMPEKTVFSVFLPMTAA